MIEWRVEGSSSSENYKSNGYVYFFGSMVPSFRHNSEVQNSAKLLTVSAQYNTSFRLNAETLGFGTLCGVGQNVFETQSAWHQNS